ncbi:O-antigen ligase family protein [Rhizobium sp. PAMB 3174]
MALSGQDVASASSDMPKAVPPGWLAAVALLIMVLAMAPVAGSLARPLFLVGCVGVGWYAWRQSPEAHLQAIVMLFCFAPFARRVVDYYVGYDGKGIMLIGPLAAMLVPIPRLFPFLDGRSSPLEKGHGPIAVVLICVAYACFMTLFKGAYFDAASGAVKWLAPLFYAMVLIETGDRERLLEAAASMFAIAIPVMGLYGMVQYFLVPGWDGYWMNFSQITSVGLPVPYEVRVFSTMNGPASFATFTAVGILLVSFLRPPLFAIISVAPASVGLMLSQYRTAWLSLAIGVLFCMLFSTTRFRSGFIIAMLFLAGFSATLVPEFNDAISKRLETFSQGTQDGSFQERLHEFVTLWETPNSSLAGIGFSNDDPGVAGTMPVDGMLIACWQVMGIVVGIFCLAAFIWAAACMPLTALRDKDLRAVILGGLGCGFLFQIPFANISAAELGFLFWIFAVMARLPGHGGKAGNDG